MNNLGGYQVLTKLAKKVGGPVNLTVLIAGGGYLLLRPVEAVSKKIFIALKLKLGKKQKTYIDAEPVYEVISNSKDNSGLEFSVGDKFRVLESDKEAILIEKSGDPNSPYFVSSDFLHTVSNFVD